jgi:hypothetical protein
LSRDSNFSTPIWTPPSRQKTLGGWAAAKCGKKQTLIAIASAALLEFTNLIINASNHCRGWNMVRGHIKNGEIAFAPRSRRGQNGLGDFRDGGVTRPSAAS